MSAVVHVAEVAAWCREYAEKIARGEAEPFHALLADPPAGIEFMGRAWDSFRTRSDHPASGEQTEEWDVNPDTPFARSATPRFKGKARAKSPSCEQPFTEHGFSDGATRIAAPTIGQSAANPMCRVCHKHKRGWKDVHGCECARPDFDERDRVRSIRDNFVGAMTDCFSAVRACLIPGAHGFVWAIPRTAHWTMMALEDAGFEMRDVVTALFGSGFPKSLDVSKAIDKAEGAEREVIGTKVGLPGYSLVEGHASTINFGPQTGSPLKECEVTVPATDAARQWSGYGTALKPAAEFWILVRNPITGTVASNSQKHGAGALNIDGARIVGPEGAGHWSGEDGSDATSTPGYDGGFTKGGSRMRAPQSDPSARRGVVGGDMGFSRSSVAQMHQAQAESVARMESLGRWPANIALSHVPPDAETGEGGCVRVGTRRVSTPSGLYVRGKDDAPNAFAGAAHREGQVEGGGDVGDGTEAMEEWRCAPNCPVAELNRQSGERAAGSPVRGTEPSRTGESGIYNEFDRVPYEGRDEPAGGASRFFHNSDWTAEVYERIAPEAPFRYVAKASRGERDAGLDGMPVVAGGVANDSGRGYKTKCGVCGGYIARSDGAKPCVCAEPQETYYRPVVLNHHPTVKPLALTRWLASLLLPPPHVAPRRIFCPFAGSGSEAIGAMLAGFEEVVAVEMSEEYAAIARARIAFWERHSHDDVAETVAAWRRSRGELAAAKQSGQMSLMDAFGALKDNP